MNVASFRFDSQADGLSVHVHTWSPEGSPRGLVQVHHGMAEHGGRYAALAEALTDRGFVVWAPDHRGHGLSVPDGETHGHFADDDGWDRVVADLVQLKKRFRAQYPGLPLSLIGHSMGSFLTMQVLMQHGGEDLAGVVLTGSNGHPGALRHLGAVVVRVEERRLGLRGQSLLIDKMSFGSFNKGIARPRTDFDWLSRDAQQVDAYVADPHCGFILSTRSWKQFLHALRLIHRDDHIARIPKDLSVLVCSGDADPVGENGAGVTRLVEAWRSAGMTEVSLHLVPGARHEVFNEIDRAETTAHVADWLETRIQG